MRFVDDVRDLGRARALAARIAQLCERGRRYRFLEVAAGHTHADYRRVLAGYLPEAVVLVPGPSCPVCAIPAGRADGVGALASRPGVVVAAYADMTAEPHAAVAGVKRVHSPLDALTIARHNGDLRVVFWAIGFEATTPSTAVSLIRAVADGVRTYSVLCDHLRLVPSLQAAIDPQLDGVIAPGDVSTVVGCAAYAGLGCPVAVSGPDPLDVLLAVHMLLRQVRDGRRDVENASRAVPWDANKVALGAIDQVLQPSGATAVRVRPHLAAYDADELFAAR